MDNLIQFKNEWDLGWKYLAVNDIKNAKSSFERAHYYGVFSVKHHFLAHYAKLRLAIAERLYTHVILQLFLMLLAPISRIIFIFYKIKLFLPMHPELKIMFDKEMEQAKIFYKMGVFEKALHHLGRAHILGSHFLFPHLRTHLGMLKIEFHNRYFKGVIIQMMRMIGALGTRFLVHFFGVTGNPGWSQYRIGTRLPVPEDLRQALIKQGLL